METDGGVEKQRRFFHTSLQNACWAFRTVPTGSTVVNLQTTKPDRSFATKTGHFYLLPTEIFPTGAGFSENQAGLSRIFISAGQNGALEFFHALHNHSAVLPRGHIGRGRRSHPGANLSVDARHST